MTAKFIDLAALTTFKTLLDLANAANFVRKSETFTDEQKAQLVELSTYQVATDAQVNSMLDEVFTNVFTGDSADAEKIALAELTANLGGYHVAEDAQVNSMLAEIFGD